MSFQMITNLIAWTIGAIVEFCKQVQPYWDEYKEKHRAR